MPIINRNDAADVEERFERIFQVPPEQRAHELRRLFAEVLDFHPGEGIVPLAAASPAAANPALPANAERIAQLDGVQALYVPLQHAPLDGRRDADRVRKQDVVAAARRIADRLGDDMLLVFANRSASQFHLIYPNFAGAQPTLRRMVVERGIPQRTAVQQVANIYWNYRDTGSIREALDNAFDVDPVTKQFFTEYHRIFNEVERSIRGFGAGDAELDAKRTFTQTLFNRLMFIYFMSRKGWLAINRDRDYLNALWQDYAATDGEQKNFYIDRLRPLFFAGLNNPKSQDHTHHDSARELIGDVPFLNGGLFEQTDLDRRAEHGGDDAVTVPDAALRRIMTDLFDKFNFTVTESTPYDVEVAVDPEMLGKVFEELVNDRHGSGSYYTPRAVVAFMCREALKGYLAGRDTALAPHAIAKFIDERDASGIPLADARRVGEALAAVAVVDPACGSGAYLLGMMQELVELQTALYNAGVDPKGVYELKLDIIQRNLYGVDNSDFAVNIAMLRMWLSLAIDYEGERPEPLPNLDLKLVCGDSLLGPDPSAAAYGDLFRALTDSRNLGAAKADYMRATHGDEKRRLKAQILDIQRELQDALGDAAVPENIVDWRIAFAEVFADAGGGFDIAIGNPPYVRSEAGDANRELRNRIVASGQYQTLYEKWDLFIPFIERGYQLIREGGITTFIVSDAYCHARYAKKSQEWFLKNSRIVRLDFFGKLQLFQAGVHNITYVFQKADGRRNKPERCVHYPDFGSVNLLPTDEQRNLTHRVFFPEDAEAQAFSAPTLPLSQVCYISYGLRPSSKPKALDKFVTADLTSDTRDEIHCKPYVDGKHLGYWLPATNLWLEWGTERSPSQFYAPTFPEFYEVNEKLLLQKNAGTNPKACYDELQFVFSASVIGAVPWHRLSGIRNNSIRKQARYGYEKRHPSLPSRERLEASSIRFDAKFLLGVLNSSVAKNFILANRRHNVSIYPDDWKNLPIPDVSLEEQAPLVDVVERILAAKRAAADTRELQ